MDTKLANAHLIADHLKAIVRILQSDPEPLTSEAEEVISFDLSNLSKLYSKLAEDLEATAPFVPLTEDETSELVLELTDEVSDYSRRECAELIYGDWTPAHWRMEWDDREEQRLEDEAEDAGE